MILSILSRLAILVALSSIPVAASAQSDSINHSEAASLAGRVGISAAQLWLGQSNIRVPPSTLSPESQSEVINEGLARYEAVRNGFEGLSTVTEATQVGVGAIIAGAALYGGPQATLTVPLTLLATASYVSLEMTNVRVEELGREHAGGLIAAIGADLAEEAGIADLAAFEGRPDDLRELIEGPLRNSEELLADTKRRALESGEPELVNMAVDVIAHRLAASDAALLVASEATAKDVAELDRDFGAFVEFADKNIERIDERLLEHENLIENLAGDLVTLDGEVKALDAEVATLGHNQDLIADFMFSGLPPTDKVAALRSGLMDNRIVCPDDRPDCDLGTIRSAMIDRFEAEKQLQDNVEAAGKILKGINDVSTIAQNLDVDLGDAGEALEIASGAVNAYIGFMAGDYLGAIASITGMFGNKPDPDAERFRIMMAYLEEQFGVINDKLDSVLQNQQTILDAVVSVSEQLQTTYERLDGRLGQMQFEQRIISENVKRLIWAPWSNCYAVYAYARDPNPQEAAPPFVNLETLRFRSFDDIQSVIDGRGESAEKCMITIQTNVASLGASHIFGNFLDAHASLSPETIEAANIPQKDKTDFIDWRDSATRHRDNIVNPASRIMGDWISVRNLSFSSLLQLQATRIDDIGALARTVDEVENGWAFACPSSATDEVSPIEAGKSIAGLVCRSGMSPDNLAEQFTQTNLSTDVLISVADWVMVVSQLADLYSFQSGSGSSRFASNITELAGYPDGYSRGEELIRLTTDVVTLGAAFQSRLNGGLTAFAVAEAVSDGAVDAKHATLLRSNLYLAENVATVLLHMKRSTWDLRAEQTIPTFEDIYAQALLLARSGEADGTQPLQALFGRDHQFVVEERDVFMVVPSPDGDVRLPLPSPIQLADGRFVFPPRYSELLHRRDALIERYLEYLIARDDELAVVVLQR